jgi:hypothetical protein
MGPTKGSWQVSRQLWCLLLAYFVPSFLSYPDVEAGCDVQKQYSGQSVNCTYQGWLQPANSDWRPLLSKPEIQRHKHTKGAAAMAPVH